MIVELELSRGNASNTGIEGLVIHLENISAWKTCDTCKHEVSGVSDCEC